jgi:hypothetical protein
MIDGTVRGLRNGPCTKEGTMRRSMLCRTGASLATACMLVASAAAATNGMTVTLSSHAASARGVRLTVVLRYEQQCGYPGAAPVVLTVPGGLPTAVPAASVLVNGKPARKVAVRGHNVTVTMPPRPQILCDSITLGRLTLVVTQAAALENPAAAGSYLVEARKGSLAFSSRIAIKAR